MGGNYVYFIETNNVVILFEVSCGGLGYKFLFLICLAFLTVLY